MPRYRAWRFLHPDFHVVDQYTGLQVSSTGGIEMVEEHESVRQAVLLLVTTRPGERVMRPDYGCDLFRLVFSPNDDTSAGLAIHYVRQALERWEPRIDILMLDAEASDDDPGRLEISLEYRVRSTGQHEHMVFPVSLTGREV